MPLALDAGLILLREGLEAVLVLATLAAFLRRAAPERGAALATGALGGLFASLGLAAVYAAFLGGEHDDRVEAATCLAAALLMLWTGGWLARNAEPRAWAEALRRRTDRALAAGERRVALAVGAIGFLAVFREGAETALFLGALGLDDHPWPILAGVAGGSVALLLLWLVIRQGTRRLPLRPLFVGTSVFLLVMAARLTAAAVQEMQEQLFVGFTPIDLPAWLAAIGMPDSAEALLAFLDVLALAPVMLWPRRATRAAVVAGDVAAE